MTSVQAAALPDLAEAMPAFLVLRRGEDRPVPDPKLIAVMQLTPEEAMRVWMRCQSRDADFPRFDNTPGETPDKKPSAKQLLFAAIKSGNGQAELVMSVMRDRDPLTSSIAEKLTGKPITMLPEKGAHAPRSAKPSKVRPSQTFSGDNDVIHLVAEGNPRKAGTRAFLLYALYRNGMTVAEYVAAGGGRGNVKCDLERGNIRLEPASAKPKAGAK